MGEEAKDVLTLKNQIKDINRSLEELKNMIKEENRNREKDREHLFTIVVTAGITYIGATITLIITFL